MGLFDAFKKKNNSNVVWRNASGQIVCPGDDCPKDCDKTCPIYLNTQAIMMMQINMNDKALELFKKALEIAPDFNDVCTNMAAIYGGAGMYQEAYDYYLKSHELNKTKPNSVYGLALCCRDLNRFEECVKWCDLYKTLSKDGRDVPIRNAAKAALGQSVEGTNKNIRF